MLKNSSKGGMPDASRPSGPHWVWFIVTGLFAFAPPSRAADETDSAKSPRLLYNAGTQKLRAGKLQDAEVALQEAVASQNEKIQPPALYNLGEVRFQQGAEELKKGPNPQAVRANSQIAAVNADGAIKAVDEALAGENLQLMVDSYLRGRGSRKELKAATEAVKKAMETYGQVLARWQRASGDFKGTSELSPADTDAKSNAELVDRAIARLVDLQQLMAQMRQGLEQQRAELGKKMAQLKMRMPGDQGEKFLGKNGDEDDDDGEKPGKEPKEGDVEPENKNGREMQMTQEEAAHLLDMLKLDGDRKLPFGTNRMVDPKKRNGRDW